MWHLVVITLSAYFVADAVQPHASATGLRGPGGYYDNIDTNLDGAAFRAQLTALIVEHSVLTYNDLWAMFRVTDRNTGQPGGCSEGQVGDVYSRRCWDSPSQQCGNYKQEGDCFNRCVNDGKYSQLAPSSNVQHPVHCCSEHVWPKSLWGGGTNPAYSDAHHLHPSDGYDNGRRANYPLGYASNATVVYETNDGSFLGDCEPAPDGPAAPQTLCWEPSDNVKGSLARVYLYVSTCYWDTFTCCDTEGARLAGGMEGCFAFYLTSWCSERQRRDAPVASRNYAAVERRISALHRRARTQRRSVWPPGQPQPFHRLPRLGGEGVQCLTRLGVIPRVVSVAVAQPRPRAGPRAGTEVSRGRRHGDTGGPSLSRLRPSRHSLPL